MRSRAFVRDLIDTRLHQTETHGLLNELLPRVARVGTLSLVTIVGSSCGGSRDLPRHGAAPALDERAGRPLVPSPIGSAIAAQDVDEDEPELDPEVIDTSADEFEQSELPGGCEKLFVEHDTFCDALRTVAAAASRTHEHHWCFEVEPSRPKPVFPRPPRARRMMLCNLEAAPPGKGHPRDCRSSAMRARDPMPKVVLTCGVGNTEYREIAKRQAEFETCFGATVDRSFDQRQTRYIEGVRTPLDPDVRQLWFTHGSGTSGPRSSLLLCADGGGGPNDGGTTAKAINYHYAWDLFFFDVKGP